MRGRVFLKYSFGWIAELLWNLERLPIATGSLTIAQIGIKHSIMFLYLVYSSSSFNRSSALRQWQPYSSTPHHPNRAAPYLSSLLYPTSHVFAGPPSSKVCLAHRVCSLILWCYPPITFFLSHWTLTVGNSIPLIPFLLFHVIWVSVNHFLVYLLPEKVWGSPQ